MALHNYIYSKHQTDVTTINKIAGEHEPRPVCLDVPSKKGPDIVADANSGQHHCHHHHIESDDHQTVHELPNRHNAEINHSSDQLLCNDPLHEHSIIQVHGASSTIDVKGTYEEELAHEGDEEEEDSDSDFLQANNTHKEERHCDCHSDGNSHNQMNDLYPHSPIQSIEEVDNPHESDSIVIVKTPSDENDAIIAIEKAQQRETKWVFVNGKKKKLKSRFSKNSSHRHLHREKTSH